MRLLILNLLSFFTFLSLSAQFTCPKTVGTELIPNGNFEAGDVGFTSGMTKYPGSGNLGSNSYVIGTNPNTYNSTYFKSMADHTPTGTGNMLVADFADGSINSVVTSFSNIRVEVGQSYTFSAWFANIGIGNSTACADCPSPYTQKIRNSPILKFEIKNQTSGATLLTQQINIDSLTNNWNQYNTFFTSTFSGNVTVNITNLRGGNSSNDLALDDISFKAGCSGIRDLSKLGKASDLEDIVYTCNENFPYTLDTKLNNSKYSFDWYTSTGGVLVNGIDDDEDLNPDMRLSPASSSTYSVASAPSNGTKYYVCYDSTGDKLTCPRLDSVTFSSQFKFDIPDQKVCPPVAVVLDPSMTTTNISSWKYEKISPTPSSVVKSGTGFVDPLTVNQVGTYSLTVVHNNSSCTASPDLIKIDTIVAAFSGAISVPCTGGAPVSGANATLVPDISGAQSVTVVGGNVKVSWYKNIANGTPVATGTGATGSTTTLATNLVSTPSCPQGGLYLQDDNSYATTVPLTNCSSSTLSEINSSNTAIFQQITLTAPASISSLNIYTKANNGNGEDLTIKVDLFASTVSLGSPGIPIATIAQRNLSGFTSTNLASVNIPGTGYVIQPGTYYVRVMSYETATPSNARSVGVQKSCRSTTASNYTDSVSSSVISFDNKYVENTNAATGVHGAFFNAKFQVGNPASCGRVWVCATCTLPVEYLYFNVEPVSGNKTLVRWGVASQKQNRFFVVEAGADGINFRPMVQIDGAGDSKTQMDYHASIILGNDTRYVRIKQVDMDGHFSYTPIKFVSSEAIVVTSTIYPQPVTKGAPLVVRAANLGDAKVLATFSDISGQGQYVAEVVLEEGADEIMLPTSELNKGIYLLNLQGEGFVENFKVIVE